MKASPAFQFYPSDFLVGSARFTLEERGIYITLLCYQWSHERLPGDLKIIARLAGCHVKKLTSVMEKFVKDPNGDYYNERLENEKSKQTAFRQRQSEIALRQHNPEASHKLPTDKPSGLPMPVREVGKEEVSPKKSTDGEVSIPPTTPPSKSYPGEINEILRIDGFPEAWERYREHRAEIGQALTTGTARSIMLKCERWGSKKAVKIIERAIEKGHKNLLDDEEMVHGSNIGKPPPKPVKPKEPDVLPEWMEKVDKLKEMMVKYPTPDTAQRLNMLAILKGLPKTAWGFFLPHEYNYFNPIIKESEIPVEQGAA